MPYLGDQVACTACLDRFHFFMQAFKDGDIRFLICTDVAARGIDISGLPYLINMTLPDLALALQGSIISGVSSVHKTKVRMNLPGSTDSSSRSGQN